jgi:hypothetical protein
VTDAIPSAGGGVELVVAGLRSHAVNAPKINRQMMAARGIARQNAQIQPGSKSQRTFSVDYGIM